MSTDAIADGNALVKDTIKKHKNKTEVLHTLYNQLLLVFALSLCLAAADCIIDHGQPSGSFTFASVAVLTCTFPCFYHTLATARFWKWQRPEPGPCINPTWSCASDSTDNGSTVGTHKTERARKFEYEYNHAAHQQQEVKSVLFVRRSYLGDMMCKTYPQLVAHIRECM